MNRADLLIKSLTNCSEAEAATVRNRIGSVLDDKLTRAFLLRFCYVAATTFEAPRGRSRAEAQVLVNEGRRQVGLFLIQCRQAQLDLDLLAGGMTLKTDGDTP